MTKIILLVIAFLVLPPVAKTTSEVYHDEIFPKIEVDNLIENGDFSNGTTGWSVTKAIWDVTDGIANITATAQGGSVYKDFNVIAGNVYYVILDYKTPYVDVVIQNYGFDIPTIPTNGTNQWTIYRSVISATTTTRYGFFSLTDRRTSEFLQWSQDNIMIFNLTSLFDVMETSGLACDNAVADIDNLIATHGYFDHLTIDLPPNYNVDLSRLGSQIITGIGEDVIKFVRNSACIVSGVAKTVTLGAIKVPNFCPTIIPPLPWIHQNYMKLLKWLKIG